jgi:hypothetical protein
MSLYVFNQYYFDLLKKVKDIARTHKKSENCNNLRKAIKNNYSSYDKLSTTHLEYFKETAQSCISTWLASVKTVEDAKQWLADEACGGVELYQGISLNLVDAVLRNKKTLLHYFVLLCIFSNDISEEDTSKILNRLKTLKSITDKEAFGSELETEFPDETLRSYILFLVDLQNSSQKPTGIEDTMKDLESTSLGKLAKEIMETVDVNEIHKSMTEEGNILKALANPEGGLAKLMGTVSQKMISKMATGELSQETLLKDALQFSGKMQNMMPKGAGGGIANMMSQMGDLSKMMNAMGGGEGFDMSKLSEMMGMMGGGGGGKKDTKTRFNTAEMSRVAKAKQMRHKLEKRKKEKEARASQEE